MRWAAWAWLLGVASIAACSSVTPHPPLLGDCDACYIPPAVIGAPPVDAGTTDASDGAADSTTDTGLADARDDGG